MSKQKKTLKTLREEAKALLDAGVANKEQLFAAVPALVALQDAVLAMKDLFDTSKDVIAKLTAKCSQYALKHPQSVFNQTFTVAANGAESGDVEIDDVMYHFCHGHNGFCRTDPRLELTHDFLATLPPNWVKTSISLDRTKLRQEKVSNETLESYGLCRKVKDVWTRVETV